MPGSLADVARRAGVSVATASRALSGSRHPVSNVVRARIEQAALEVGYAPSALARALVTRRSRIIGVIVGDIVDPYFAEITRGAEDVARRHGYMTIICNTDRTPVTELAYVRLLRDYQAEGIVFAGGGFDLAGEALLPPEAAELDRTVDQARTAGVRVISLAARSFPSTQVSVDNRAACYDVTSYAISLGHRRIAHVRGPAGLSTSAARLNGFQAAMNDAQLDPSLVYDGNFDYESGQAAVTRMLGRQLPDAIIGANDESAIGVLMTLRQAGVRVPADVSVAGIDDTRPSRFVDLTTVSVPMYELGALAARRILERPRDASDDRTVLPHRLVPRGTTARREHPP